jgi:hypothetical protein
MATLAVTGVIGELNIPLFRETPEFPYEFRPFHRLNIVQKCARGKGNPEMTNRQPAAATALPPDSR